MTVVLNSTKIKVCWEDVPIINQNGKLIAYQVQYDPSETFGGQITTESTNSSDISLLCTVLTGLEEYVEYNISVRAYTSVGPGPYSVEISNMTEMDSKLACQVLTGPPYDCSRGIKCSKLIHGYGCQNWSL